VVICLKRGADLHMAQLTPLPLTVSCFSKIQIVFTFLVRAHPGSPGQRAVKRVCVCVCMQTVLNIVCTRALPINEPETTAILRIADDTSLAVADDLLYCDWLGRVRLIKSDILQLRLWEWSVATRSVAVVTGLHVSRFFYLFCADNCVNVLGQTEKAWHNNNYSVHTRAVTVSSTEAIQRHKILDVFEQISRPPLHTTLLLPSIAAQQKRRRQHYNRAFSHRTQINTRLTIAAASMTWTLAHMTLQFTIFTNYNQHTFTVSQKKNSLAITSPNVNWFSNFFRCQIKQYMTLLQIHCVI